MGSTKIVPVQAIANFLAISKNIGIMKLLSFATVIAPTLANLNTIEKKWEDMTVDELRIECKKFQDEAGNYVDGTPDVCLGIRGTAFDGQMLLFSSATPKYGCWCDLENSLKRASNGDPVNDLDRACRDLHHNYNCITIEDPSCNPRTLDASVGEYNLPISALLKAHSISLIDVVYHPKVQTNSVHLKDVAVPQTIMLNSAVVLSLTRLLSSPIGLCVVVMLFHRSAHVKHG